MGWLWWLGAVLVLVVVEMLTVDLIFLMLAGGALAGMIVHLAGFELWVQVLAFALTSVILLFAVRPGAKRWMLRHTPTTLTNAHALVGREAVVVHDVSKKGGRVKLAGEVWTARSKDDLVIREDSRVYVHKIDGAIAIVDEAPPIGGPHA
ncbi:hypothetical protein BSZ39_02060 [Bowdeniella nasicola]|uniref:NfeD-like C-terminal domain-containing protein n=1 Tax=Bowdeniella nasicola TaxID=208480 RepID=A0A1Q5Q4Q0_9ACTO|nr:NfeD family protein [Bowdeniella nasicola]OKL54786.1 hypothetical protein BSZ39_02060 [Bowdeniella nasicola]